MALSQDLDDLSVSPPLIILDHAQVLREIMIVYDSSLVGDETEEQLATGFGDILDKMVDPAIETCVTSSEEKRKHRPTWDKSVFVLNTLAYLQGVIEPYRFTAEKQGVIQGLIETKVLQLTEEHVGTFVVLLGWADLRYLRVSIGTFSRRLGCTKWLWQLRIAPRVCVPLPFGNCYADEVILHYRNRCRASLRHRLHICRLRCASSPAGSPARVW